MKKLLTLFILATISLSVHAQGDDSEQAQSVMINLIKNSQAAKKAKKIAQHKTEEYVDEELIEQSAYIAALISQKIRYRKNEYYMDLNLKSNSLIFGVKYEF